MNKLPKKGKDAIDIILKEDAKHLILSGYRGSIAHNMYVPNLDPNSIDDKDVMGVMVLPEEYYLGLKKKDHIETFVQEWDIVVYEARKFINLLLKNNPNVLSMLWLEDVHYIHRSSEGNLLIENRDIFLSKQCYKSFCGYAYSQLHRMEHMAFEGYMGEKRKGLVKQHGYDTKNAAHLIRLLRMGIEVLTEGTVIVSRPDAQQLLGIKRGEWTLQQVKDEADRLFKVMEQAYVNSKLPSQPDTERAEELLIDIVKSRLGFTPIIKKR